MLFLKGLAVIWGLAALWFLFCGGWVWFFQDVVQIGNFFAGGD